MTTGGRGAEGDLAIWPGLLGVPVWQGNWHYKKPFAVLFCENTRLATCKFGMSNISVAGVDVDWVLARTDPDLSGLAE